MDRLKIAFKFALSMMLAYWLALYMNWELPQYAGLAIVLISLDTQRASFLKGTLRIVGSLIGILIGFLIIDWFGQNRWGFLCFVASYLLFVSYFMQRSKFSYAWFVAGFVPLLVWSHSYMNVSVAFGYGVYRFLETAAGIVIYMLLSILLWPNTGILPAPYKEKKSFWDKEVFFKALVPTLSFIVGFVFWVWTNPPAGTTFIGFTVIFSLIFLTTPIYPPLFAAIVLLSVWFVVAPVYFFIMPAHAGGSVILLVIFAYSLLFGYLGTWSFVYKVAPVLIFVMLTNITNQQSYAFLTFANVTVAMLLATTVIWIVQMLLTHRIFDYTIQHDEI